MNANGFNSLELEHIRRYHRHEPADNQCSSALVKHIKAPVHLRGSLEGRYCHVLEKVDLLKSPLCVELLQKLKLVENEPNNVYQASTPSLTCDPVELHHNGETTNCKYANHNGLETAHKQGFDTMLSH